MRNVFTSILLLLTFYTSSAQKNYADSIIIFYKLDSIFTEIYENEPVAAQKIVERQEVIAKQLNNDSLKIKVAYNKGDVMFGLGNQDVSIASYFAVLRLAKKVNYPYLESWANYNIGIHYQHTFGDYTRAESFVRKAYEIAVNSKAYTDTISFNYSIAKCVANKGDVDGCIKIMERNIEAAKKLNLNDEIRFGLESLAFIYFIEEKYEKSLETLKKILPYLKILNHNSKTLSTLIHIAEMSISTNQWDSASKYNELSFQYAALVNTAEWYYECYEMKSKILEHYGKYNEALKAHKKFVECKDSVFQKGYNDKMAALSAKYSLDKKQSEIALLQRDNTLREIKIKEQKMERNIIILSGVLLIVLLAAILRGWMNRKTKLMQQIFSRSLIKNQEKDKQRIAQELHDSIGQNILFIKNQVSSQPVNEKQAQILQAISTTMEEVRDISKELYPNQLEKYGLEASVNTLAEKTTTATGVFVSADIADIEPKLTKEAKINCYRIIQECITNTLKHANAQAIRITGVLQKNKVIITIIDNGRGFDEAILDKKAQTSFGLLGIEERVKLMNGKMLLDSSAAGTKITITFPFETYGT